MAVKPTTRIRSRPAPSPRRGLSDAGSIPLVGGNLCLDFVNTTGARASAAPRERLVSGPAFLTWAIRAGVIDLQARKRLERRRRDGPAASARSLDRIRGLRECLYRALLAARSGAAPAARDVAELARWARRAAAGRQLAAIPGGVRLSWRPEGTLESACGPILAAALELLAAIPGGTVKQCRECDWLFLDRSRNRSRTWCKKLCRDRVKARRYYRRKRDAR